MSAGSVHFAGDATTFSSTPLSSSASTDIDYTVNTVPLDIKRKPIKHGILFVDVISAGAKVGTGLDERQASDRGQIKNHWTFRAHLDLNQNGPSSTGQVAFGMEVVENTSIGSDEAQYTRSSDRSDPASQSTSASPSSARSFSEPIARYSDEGAATSLWLAPNSGRESQHTYDSHSIVFNDVESVGKPPDTNWSDDGHFSPQRTEGATQPGVLKIKVRGRITPSESVIAVFQLALVPGTTFGDPSSDRFPHLFLCPSLYSSQDTAKWLQAHVLYSGEAKQVLGRHLEQTERSPDRTEHIFTLLGWRYTNPQYDGGGESGIKQRRDVRIPKPIDRAVWPNGFTCLEDRTLKYSDAVMPVP